MSGLLDEAANIEHIVQHRHSFFVSSPKDDKSISSVDVVQRHGVVFVENMWTDGEQRRQGLAARCLTEAIAHYGHDDLYLNVGAYGSQPLSDQELIEWYGRFGFEIVPNAPGLMRRPGDG